MEAVWALDAPTVSQVCEHLGSVGSPKTIMTVMNRLVDKGMLNRTRFGRAFHYSATEERQAFVRHVSRRVAEELVQDYGLIAVAQFVDAVGSSQPELLDELNRLVSQRQGNLAR